MKVNISKKPRDKLVFDGRDSTDEYRADSPTHTHIYNLRSTKGSEWLLRLNESAIYYVLLAGKARSTA